MLRITACARIFRNYLNESTRLLYAQSLGQSLHAAVPNGRGLSFVQKVGDYLG